MGRTGRMRQRKRREDNTVHAAEEFLSPLLHQLSWLGWRNKHNLVAHNFPKFGRGICSKTQTFSSGDTLIRLPLSCMVTIATLEEAVHFRAQFDASKFNKDVPFQALLAFYVLHQKHLEGASHINAYIKSIPKQFTTPYFCLVDELQCLPEEILEKTVCQNRIIRESYTCLKSCFHTDRCSYCKQIYFDEIYSLSAFKWAYFAVNTRSVYVCSRQIKPTECFFQSLLSDEPNMALAPFLDLFNHSAEVSTKAEMLPTGPNKQLEFVLTLEHATAAIPPRSQLFISYGALSNCQLLIEYGFSISRNPHDYFVFTLKDIEGFLRHDKSYCGPLLHRNKFVFIRDRNLHHEMFVHLDEGASHNLCVVLHLLLHEQCHYTNVLNQVAFGAAENLANVEVEVCALVRFKIEAYKKFIGDLDKLPTLGESGKVAKNYLEECKRYLEEYVDKFVIV